MGTNFRTNAQYSEDKIGNKYVKHLFINKRDQKTCYSTLLCTRFLLKQKSRSSCVQSVCCLISGRAAAFRLIIDYF